MKSFLLFVALAIVVIAKPSPEKKGPAASEYNGDQAIADLMAQKMGKVPSDVSEDSAEAANEETAVSYDYTSICQRNGIVAMYTKGETVEDILDVDGMTDKINNEFIKENPVMQFCPDAFNEIIENENCKALYEEGFCYFNVGADRYEEITVDNIEEKLTFQLIEGGVRDAESFGLNMCQNAEKCYDHAYKIFTDGCMTEPAFAIAFATETDNMLDFLREKLEEMVEEEPDSVMGRLSEMALERIENKTFAELQQEYNDKYAADATEAGETVKEMALSFCEEGCVSKTAASLSNENGTGLLQSLTNHPTCSTMARYCEDCRDFAAKHFQKFPVPCCLKTVIDAGIEAFDEFYDSDVEETVEEFFDESQEEEKEIFEKVKTQLTCYRESYTSGDAFSGCEVEEETAEDSAEDAVEEAVDDSAEEAA